MIKTNGKDAVFTNPQAFYNASGKRRLAPVGDVVKLVPDASSRQYAGLLSTDGAARDDIVTQVVQVQNIGAAQLVPILRPLIPQYGHLAAHPGSNMLIISDRAANVTRMLNIIRRIDQSNDDDIEVVRLQHASAAEIVRLMTTLTQQPRADGVPVNTSLVADARTNSVLIGGDKSERLRLRALSRAATGPVGPQGGSEKRKRNPGNVWERERKHHHPLEASD